LVAPPMERRPFVFIMCLFGAKQSIDAIHDAA
jgi:hypothetical protein